MYVVLGFNIALTTSLLSLGVELVLCLLISGELCLHFGKSYLQILVMLASLRGTGTICKRSLLIQHITQLVNTLVLQQNSNRFFWLCNNKIMVLFGGGIISHAKSK